MTRDRFDIGRLDGPDEEYSFAAGGDEAGGRLDAILAARYKWLSRTEAKKLAAAGRVFVARASGADPEAAVLRGSFRLAPGDRVRLVFPRRPQDIDAARAAPPEDALSILYEDECLVVIDKPAGIPVHPVGSKVHRTVLTALHRYCRERGVPESDLPILAHRLDLDTTGVLLAVKGREAAARVWTQFRRRTVHKEYLALVYGNPEHDEGVVDLPIGPDEGSPLPHKQIGRSDGSPAVTRYLVERRGSRFALVRVVPETGRQHQIRVHLAALGHPIVGDKIYGRSESYFFKAQDGELDDADRAELVLPRHALHAALLRLRHPRSDAETAFESPLPADMLNVLTRDAEVG